MRALQVKDLGQKRIIQQVSAPVPGPGEVLVDVGACGLNFADLLMIKGEYQERPDLPFTPGMEIAGRIAALGPGVEGPPVGTRICAFMGHGGLAEQAIVPVRSLAVVPDSMTVDVAAGFQVAYGTSHVALAHRAALAEGENLVVFGAAGGVGLTAVELGKAMGATVIACARGQDKLQVAKSAGADHLIDSDTDNIRDAIRNLGGADVVYDPVGGDHFSAALRATNPEGRMLVIGFAAGAIQPIPANIILVKNITVIGFYWGGYLKFRPEVLTDSLQSMFDWYGRGMLKPHISNILQLEGALDGFDLLRTRKATGKVVIRVNQDVV